MVIGLNLCPFAQRVFDAGTIHYSVSNVLTGEKLAIELATEIERLMALNVTLRETSFLIHPKVLTDFRAYNEFLDVADRVLVELGLEGSLQIASFHPAYQFAGTRADAAENFTNRSPFPMLHLLREQSISTVEKEYEDLSEIPRRNVAMLNKLGTKQILQRLKDAKVLPPYK